MECVRVWVDSSWPAARARKTLSQSLLTLPWAQQVLNLHSAVWCGSDRRSAHVAGLGRRGKLC